MKSRWLILLTLVCTTCSQAPPPPPMAAPAPPPAVATGAPPNSMNLVTMRLAKPGQPELAGTDHKQVNIVLLVKQPDDPRDVLRRNEILCGGLMGAVPAGTGTITPDERVIWWADSRDTPPASANCDDLVGHYNFSVSDYYLRLASTPAQNLNGKGPYLVSMTRDASANLTGWLIDCSSFDTPQLYQVASEWANAIHFGQIDPNAIKTAVSASAQTGNVNATPQSQSLWSFLPTVWAWISSHGTQIASAAATVIKFIGIA